MGLLDFIPHNSGGGGLLSGWPSYTPSFSKPTPTAPAPTTTSGLSGQFGMDGIPGDWNWTAPSAGLNFDAFKAANPNLSQLGDAYLQKAWSKYSGSPVGGTPSGGGGGGGTPSGGTGGGVSTAYIRPEYEQQARPLVNQNPWMAQYFGGER